MATQTITVVRATEADPGLVLAALKGLDATSSLQLHEPGSPDYVVTKATAWTTPQITAARNAIQNAAAQTAQTLAQTGVDTMSQFDKARDLVLIDQINVLRAALRGLGVQNLPDVTPAQAIAAIRTKAGQVL